MEYEHETRDGTIIKISEMSDQHLINTIRMIRKRAVAGITLRSGGGSFPDDH
jgi:hypothetical protein